MKILNKLLFTEKNIEENSTKTSSKCSLMFSTVIENKNPEITSVKISVRYSTSSSHTLWFFLCDLFNWKAEHFIYCARDLIVAFPLTVETYDENIKVWVIEKQEAAFQKYVKILLMFIPRFVVIELVFGDVIFLVGSMKNR